MGSRGNNGRGEETRLITHYDVNGKALVFLLIAILAVSTLYLVQTRPPAVVSADANVSNYLQAEGGMVYCAVPGRGQEVPVLGLDYQPPGGEERDGKRLAVTPREEALKCGQLKGYSVPPRRIAFRPGGGYVCLPGSPALGGPVQLSVVSNGDRSRPRVALTFDSSDVSEPRARLIIDRLTELRAPATFFVCGGWCHANPELLRLSLDRGFEIASHSYNHPYFTRLTNEEIVWQLEATSNAVKEVSGHTMSAYFRPPYGDFDARVAQIAANCGYSVIMWDRDTRDWEASTTAADIRDRASSGVENGAIVIMHMGGRYTADALEEAVRNLRDQGFELTTVTGVLQP